MEAASSGSDDSSSEGSESRRRIGRKAVAAPSKRSLEDDDEGAGSEDERENNGRDDPDDSSSEEDSDAGSEADSRRNPEEESDSESDDDADEEEEEEDESAPLAERIRRQREQGVSMNAPRQRKSRARKIASERLAQFRKEKKTKEDDDDSVEAGAETGVSTEKKKSKHAPTESSSKRADFYRRKPMLNENGIGVDIGAHKYKPRDPRVDSLSGHLDVQHFEHNFDFLQDMRQKEMGTLKKNIAARKASGRNGQTRRRRMGLTNDGGSLEEDQLELKRLTQEKADVERARIDRAAKQTVKKKLHEDVAEGKRGVFFPKRKELKRLHLEAKYEEIRKRGGDRAVDKVVAKRRKKNKSKDAGLLGKGIPKNYGNAAAGTSQK
jgi:ribosomal RNA-processing protein 36